MTKTHLTRRHMLGAIAASVLGGTGAGSQSKQSKKATFVLVHGAWHGGWCWKKVVPLLEGAGHRVLTPTLTGLGERAHLLSPQIDLTTHIQDIAAVFEYEDLGNVTLVGHSYARMVISGVVQRVRTRLAHLVYLDAFLPDSGTSVKDYSADAPLDELARTKGDGWRLPMVPTLKELGVTNRADVAWMFSRLGDQPYKTFIQPVQFAAKEIESVRRTFIHTSELFTKEAERAKRQGFGTYALLSAGHDAMVTKPNELIGLLLRLV
jgi:pimeloyl-ACP methyl ester carboxylesterase